MTASKRTAISLTALLMLTQVTFVVAAEATSAPNADYRIVDCPPAAGGTDSVKIDVTNVPANRVLSDVIHLKHLHVRHPERIKEVRVTLHFACQPVHEILSLLAYVSGPGDAVQRDESGGYRIGPVKHHEEIENLRKDVIRYIESRDKAQEKIALQKIIDLAKPETPDDLKDNVSDEYADLAEMAMQEQAYTRAEELDRARLAQIERHRSNDNDDYSLALAALAYARIKQGDAEAETLLARALAMMQKHPGPGTLPASARALSNLAVMALEAKHSDEAEALSARAYAVLSEPDQKDWDPLELYRAQTALSVEEDSAGNDLVQRDDRVAAAVHYEHALALNEKLQGEGLIFANHEREMVVLTNERPEELEHVGNYYARHLAAMGKGDSSGSSDYAKTLFNLTLVRAKQEKYAEAISAWQQAIEVRRHFRGENSPQVIAALHDLALLYRLNRQLPEADATEKQADAIKTDDTKNALQLVGGLQEELQKILALFLKIHFDDRIEILNRRTPHDDAALALAREQRAQCMTTLRRLYLGTNMH